MCWLKRLQAKQPRTAYQGFVHLEKGVFGGGSDQIHRAVFHPGQQGVLLCTVETVHLVDEQGGAQAMVRQALLGRVHLGPQILDAGKYGIEAAEVGPGAASNDPGQGGFAHPRRAVQDQVADSICSDGAA